jgi:hypothetical protein
VSEKHVTGIAEGACCYCGKQIEQPAEYGIHLLSDLEDPQVDLCVECGSKETPTCEQIWERNAERLRALEAEGRPYKLRRRAWLHRMSRRGLGVRRLRSLPSYAGRALSAAWAMSRSS